MQSIELEFDLGSYHHAQVERQGDLAIYSQTHRENPKVVRFEVIRIRIHREHVWPNGDISPEREGYPGANHGAQMASPATHYQKPKSFLWN